MDVERIIRALGQEGMLVVESSADLASNTHKAAKKRAKDNDAYDYRKKPAPVSVRFPAGITMVRWCCMSS